MTSFQYIYLRASNEKERQKWLVGLGTAKANICNANKGSIETATTRAKSPTPESTDELKTKKAELRLYCDLLLQQVHSVKESVSNPRDINVDQLEEDSGLLSRTCDTFIRTLEDTMTLASEMPTTPPPLPPPTVPLGNLRVGDAAAHRRTSRNSLSMDRSPTPNQSKSNSSHRQNSVESSSTLAEDSRRSQKSPTPNGFQSVFGGNSHQRRTSESTS